MSDGNVTLLSGLPDVSVPVRHGLLIMESLGHSEQQAPGEEKVIPS